MYRSGSDSTVAADFYHNITASSGSTLTHVSANHRYYRMTGEACPIPRTSDVFTIGDQIGSGSFSNVYKAVDNKTQKTIAIKAYRMKTKDPGHFSRAAKEMAFIRFLQHPNIIGYILSDIKTYYMYLGIEYSPYGSLANFMEKRNGFTEVTVKNVTKQLVSALCYLHSMYIFHGDVKPENIIVSDIKDNVLMIKLSDFGLADVILKNDTHHKKSGSFYYMAPEIHLGFPSDHTADLFAVGVLMYEMLFAEKPFNSSRMPKLHYVNTLRRRVEVRFPMFESNFVSPCCLALIRNLLSYDKQNRLSGEDLVKHPFLDIEYVKDEQSHYMKACECLVSGVELVNSQKLGAGYIDTTEAILHLKIHINRIHDDEALLKYTMSRYNEYTKYCEQIEDRLLSDRNSGPICMQSQSEKLRCLLKSTPGLVSGYDMCSVGEMYFVQCNRQKGAEMIKQGLDVLFPLLVHEPDGLRKHLLASKIDQWMKMLEKLKRDQAFIVRR